MRCAQTTCVIRYLGWVTVETSEWKRFRILFKNRSFFYLDHVFALSVPTAETTSKQDEKFTETVCTEFECFYLINIQIRKQAEHLHYIGSIEICVLFMAPFLQSLLLSSMFTNFIVKKMKMQPEIEKFNFASFFLIRRKCRRSLHLPTKNAAFI